MKVATKITFLKSLFKGTPQSRGASLYLSTPDLLNCCVVGVKLKGLCTELYGCLCSKQDHGHVEQDTAHQGCPHFHGMHCEDEQVEAHFGGALDHTRCIQEACQKV